MVDAGPVLGIDLGTTNSVVAVADGAVARVLPDAEGHRLIPSCVSFHPDGRILVGHEARQRRLVDPENTVYSIKRLIGRPFDSDEVRRARARMPFALEESKSGGVQVRTRRGTHTLAEISAFVLRQLRTIAEAALDVECRRAVITVPANFNELQRSATQAAGKVAGLDVLRILNEPTAATLAYGCGRDARETVAVYDLGGGTFDITILDLDGDVFEVLATGGDTFLGGDDIDLAIADRMREACLAAHGFDARTEPQAFERMRAAAEWAKCQLSSVSEAELTLEDLFQHADGRASDFSFRMTRNELERMVRPWVERSLEVVTQALREAGKRPKEIDEIVLVGGSTRIPLVRRMVEAFFGKKPRTNIDPDLVVAQGAAIHGWTLAGGSSKTPPRAPSRPVGRVALRTITLAAPSARSAAIVEELVPRGPAFAPEESPLVSGPSVPLGSAAAAPSNAPQVDPMRRDSLEAPAPVAVIAPPRTVGAIGGPGLMLDLDDPLVREASREPSRDAPAPDVPRPLGAPAASGSALGPPPRKATLLTSAVDAPFAPPTPASARGPAAGSPERDARASDFTTLDVETLAPEAGSEPPAAPIAPPAAVSVDLDDPASLALSLHPPPVPRTASPAVLLSPVLALDVDASAPAASAGRVAQADAASEAKAPAAPPLAPRIAELPMPARPAPLLMDVTPLTLGLETAGGFCTPIVPRNAPVPAERSRIFSTARDDQDAVEVRICQGESMKFSENQLLGTLVLDGLRKGPRGTVRVEITFQLDASGILDVRAVDLDTRRQQQTRIHLHGGHDSSEIEEMRARQERELA